MTPKGRFEINWPLAMSTILLGHLFGSLESMSRYGILSDIGSVCEVSMTKLGLLTIHKNDLTKTSTKYLLYFFWYALHHYDFIFRTATTPLAKKRKRKCTIKTKIRLPEEFPCQNIQLSEEIKKKEKSMRAVV